MSAIFGILRFDGAEVSARDLERMGNVLAHRGLDGRKFVAEGAAGLGHCLMRVNNEDLFEAQPLRDHDAGLTLVADCRIDNREELADAFGLSADDIRDMPDSAFILRAYKLWGADAASRLLGDFAFSVWDARANKLVLGRDHMGQRNVHYHRGKDFFAFATEIKALWALPDVPREIDEQQLGRFLLLDHRPHESATLFTAISGLGGGATMTVSDGGALTKRQYWVPCAVAEHQGRDEPYYVKTYRRVLAEAVNCRIDRLIDPPALLLSAGYDSAAIAGMCGPVLTAKERKLIAISSVLPADDAGPSKDVRRWVEYCRRDMPHLDVRYFVREADALMTELDPACRVADRIPVAPGYILNGMFRIAAGSGARLVMDGLGGDSTLNPRGSAALAYFLRKGRFRRFLSELAARRRVTGHSLWTLLRSQVAFRLAPIWLRRLWLELRHRGPMRLRRFVEPAFLLALRDTVVPMHVPWLRGEVGLREANARSLRNFAMMPRGHYSNEAAVLGLDLTRPMIDKRVVEFGLAIPEDLHVVNGRSRDLACRALADVYPREYRNRERRQDPFDPNFPETIGRAMPAMRAELRRMGNSTSVRKYIALDALNDACSETSTKTAESADAVHALRAFAAARYIAWFQRENR